MYVHFTNPVNFEKHALYQNFKNLPLTYSVSATDKSKSHQVV